MKHLHNENTSIVDTKNNKAVTTSLKIAEVFGKEHKNVVRDIENLEIPESFNRLNFEQIFYKDSYNRKQKAYQITKDGFTLLAMGYTGRKAMEFKIKYIEAFNRMEQVLSEKANNSDSVYFETKKTLVAEKHELDIQIKALNNKINNSPEGVQLSQKQEALRNCKIKIEKLETKYFKYRYTLFPELDFEN